MFVAETGAAVERISGLELVVSPKGHGGAPPAVEI
jgi:hypothetical protein